MRFLAQELSTSEVLQLVFVADEGHVEVADLLLDNPPLLHPAQSFENQAVGGQAQGGFAGGGWQIAAHMEGEATGAPAQAFEYQCHGLLGHRLAQAFGREVSLGAKVGAQ